MFEEFTEWAIENNLSIKNTSKKDYPINPSNN